MREGKMYRVNHQKKGDLKKHGHNYTEIYQKGKKLVCFGKLEQLTGSWQLPSKNEKI